MSFEDVDRKRIFIEETMNSIKDNESKMADYYHENYEWVIYHANF